MISTSSPENFKNTPILHVALATYPYGQSKDFIKAVYNERPNNGVKDYYSTYRKGIESYGQKIDERLYKPGVYHLFGNYDVAFISFIDSYKFAQKLFAHKNETNLTLPNDNNENQKIDFNPNSFQIITGITLATSDGFETNKLPSFVSICNLKLNNGLLIGNGQYLVDEVKILIEEIIQKYNENKQANDKVKYAIMQSFSWAEICLMIFSNTIDDIPKITTQLRTKRVLSFLNKDSREKIVNNSLYKASYATGKKASNEENIDTEFFKSHIFSDSHSYFGVKFSDFENEKIDMNSKLKTETEWMIKPGHLSQLQNELKRDNLKRDNEKKENIFDDTAFFVHGKTDFIIPQKAKDNSIVDNQKLFKRLIDKDDSIHHHVRKVKTRTFFEITEEYDWRNDNIAETLQLSKAYKHLKISNDRLEMLSKNLIALKVSRQIRDKILKVFNNYNTGIQDPVLFTFFIDFHSFMERLVSLIEFFIEDFTSKNNQLTNYEKSKLDKVSLIEKYLDEYINIFEEGYHIRMLNCYMYEEIDDFDLDFNSSIQQLLTTYNTFVYELSKTFESFKNDNYAPIVSLNLRKTVSNILSINYNVYHLTTPELVFSTIIKEIFNSYTYFISNQEKKEMDSLEKLFNEVIDSESTLQVMRNNNLIEFERIYIDIIRVIYTYNSDVKLFEFWFCAFNFQNSSLYNTRGSFNEGHFKTELFRLLFVYSIFSSRDSEKEEDWIDLKCPLPELQIYWDRYYISFRNTIKKLLGKDKQIIHLFIDIIKEWENVLDEAMGFEITKSGNRIRPTLINNFYQKHKKDFKVGNTALLYKIDINNKVSEKLLYINSLIYSYLRILWELNSKELNLLRRNWDNGKPLKKFIEKDSGDFLYNIDPLGGFFIIKPEKSKEYNKILNTMLQTIWHFSQVMKKEYIIENIDINNGKSFRR